MDINFREGGGGGRGTRLTGENAWAQVEVNSECLST